MRYVRSLADVFGVETCEPAAPLLA